MRARLAGALTAVGLLIAGCSGSGSGTGLPGPGSARATGGGTGSGGTTGTAAQAASYGYGARTSGVDYQPDVVVVGGGPGAIRSVSDDGLTWTIDRNAPGAGRLQVGKVMLMTSVAAGRVAAVHDDGTTRVVTIAPVELTDILRNGKIDLKQGIDSSKLSFQPVPGLTVGPKTPAPGDLPSATHSFVHAGRFAVAGPLPPPTSLGGSFSVGNFELTPSVDTTGKLGLGMSYKGSSGLKFSGSIAFLTKDLTIDGSLAVSNGQRKDFGFWIEGITGIQVSLAAGTSTGSAGDGKVTLTLPGEFKYPIPPSPATGDLPLTVTVKYSLSLGFALTGKNSTLTATGKYKLVGPIGYRGPTKLTPTFSTEQSLLDSLGGITLGPSGVVVALKAAVQVGVGTPLLNAGPKVGVTVSIGVTNGSSFGAPLARCKGATLDLDLNVGASLDVDSSLVPIIKRLLPAGTSVKFGLETKTNLLHRAQVVPDVPLCR